MMMGTREGILIPESELVFQASRSSGPGGQNVNKLNTRIVVLFHVPGSTSLSDEQKRQVLSKLATRVDKEGVLRVASQKHRSQEANRRAAVARLQELIWEALKPRPARKKTTAPAAARERSLREKKQRSTRKRQRTGRDWGEQ
jgi:ribosome-associated protein